MTDKELLDVYKELLPFLGKILGEGTEFLIHDVSHPDKSVIAITNNQSGRKIGSPMTNLANEMLQQGLHTKKDYIVNYNGQAKKMNFLSSTYFIKNKGKLIGLLCVNKNLSSSKNVLNLLQALYKEHNLEIPEKESYTEKLDTNLENYVEMTISQLIASNGIDPRKINSKEKKIIIKKLEDNGVFKLKGAIEETAKQLYLSIPSVYRYLKQNK